MTFNNGDEAKKMFFVKSGDLDYVAAGSMHEDRVTLRQKDWLTEPVLFTAWRHKGSLQALTESELITVDPQQFMTVMSVHPRPWHCAVKYAKVFVQFLNREPKNLTDIIRCDGLYEALMMSCEGEFNGQEERGTRSSLRSAVSSSVHPASSGLSIIGRLSRRHSGRYSQSTVERDTASSPSQTVFADMVQKDAASRPPPVVEEDAASRPSPAVEGNGLAAFEGNGMAPRPSRRSQSSQSSSQSSSPAWLPCPPMLFSRFRGFRTGD